MRILHTADWHISKRVGRYDRMDDHRAALDEVVRLADFEGAELVLVAGDLFDRPYPPVEALKLGLDTLKRLAAGGRPVVAIAGNHDSPELFEVLAPLVAADGIHLIGQIRRPSDGGVVAVEAGGQRALISCLPFLKQGKAVDFLQESGGWHDDYSERIAALCAAHGEYLAAEGDGAVKLLMAHFMVTGVRLGGGGSVGGGGSPRGERELHIGAAYAATEQAVPPGFQYAALGHIHKPQEVPGAPIAARYCGSLLELDFGEAGEEKEAVLVEVEPGRPATVRSLPIAAGRRLRRLRGGWDELAARRDELADSYLDLEVETGGPEPGLADRARETFPHLVKVRAIYQREQAERPARAGRPWDELYAEYHRAERGVEASPELLACFRELLDEVRDAPP